VAYWRILQLRHGFSCRRAILRGVAKGLGYTPQSGLATSFIHIAWALTMYDITKLLHLVAAIVWMGGMTFMLFALRPAALVVMEPQPRAKLMVEVWQRFFAIVAIAVLVLLATGGYMYANAVKAARAAGGTAGVPIGWSVMVAIGLVMFLIFVHIYFAGLRKFKRAVAAGEWPVAAQVAGLIHKMVVANFVLGWLAIAAVRLVR
jgi:uncharacterized membrane protein